ncbi:hypothetical protein [Yinghuangia soli]|uniref:Uncharacterized protein n=1 Tax=Yinghuangia soli TaxID=2908204 RepID=A0AA41Q280_9ACTN|nr:hypothetical protein [Yinghuangia soli]MCF2528747.1 hypothetical protein [Yinghuangia soli]
MTDEPAADEPTPHDTPDRPDPDRSSQGGPSGTAAPASTAVRVARTLLGAAGLAGIGYGIAGLLDEPAYTDKWGVAEWLVGGLLLHDAVFAVLVFVLGAAAMRAAPGRGPAPWVRRTFLGGLAVGIAATLIALPALVRPGTPPNPSVLPLDYGRNLAVVWGVVLAVTGITIAVRKWRAGRG